MFKLDLEKAAEAKIKLSTSIWIIENASFARTSLVVQWLRLCVPSAEDLGSIPSLGNRFHVLQLKIPHATTMIEDPMCCN